MIMIFQIFCIYIIMKIIMQNQDCHFSRVVNPEKQAYLVRNKNPSVIWILNDQNSSKCSPEEFLLQGPFAATLAIEIPYYSLVFIDTKFAWSMTRLMVLPSMKNADSFELKHMASIWTLADDQNHHSQSQPIGNNHVHL